MFEENHFIGEEVHARMGVKYVVWGTGNKAKHMMEDIKKYENDFTNICKYIYDQIICFVDSDIEKKGKKFYNKSIKAPLDIDWDKTECHCIVAMADSSDVVKFLENHIKDKRCIVSDTDFIYLFHRELLKHEPIQEDLVSTDNFFSIAKYLLKWKETNVSLPQCYCSVRNKYNSSVYEFLSALYFVFFHRFGLLAQRCQQEHFPLKERAKIKTIGLIVPVYGGGGAERVVSHLLSLYHDMGYEVILITRKSQNNGEYELPYGVLRIEIQHLFDEQMSKCIKELELTIKENQIDLLFIHIPYEGFRLFYVVLLAKFLGVYVIVENHTSFINAIRQRGEITSNEKIYKLLDYMIVLSRVDCKFWTNLGCRCKYIPNPCVDLLKAVKKTDYVRQKNTILWVGRLDNKYKRFFDIIPIMRNVVQKIPDAKIMVVGRPVRKDEHRIFKEKILKNHLEDSIILCGGQENVKKFYCSAEVMLITSPGEGFPMVMAEAMSCGLPIVMYDLPYLELVRNGKGLAVVPQGDTHQAAEKIVNILQNEKMRVEMSKEIREAIEPYLHYDLKSEWKSVFDEILQGEMASIKYDEDMAMIERLLSEGQ